MAGWSQTIIVGNVGRDPEMRYLQSGVGVCSFSVAVSRRWTDRNTQEQREETTWYRVSAWRQLAETANQFVRKGMQVMVIGQVKARAYLDNSGQPAASIELTADDIRFLGSRGDGAGGDDGGYGAPQSDMDNIPF
ncbi:single-stranded DNA-binding protein [Anaerolineae bacterium CFX9]|jgi:single-strand DNA-binding protein|nr:single-stranded DNA-binding protein [Oscillatoria laete-virens]MDK3158884.1 single-stranded DNA-binding protein [Kamptonema cortianum]MDL1899419.1 single-stranded DNA-binding protein [Anaerolineae bacterium CFX9]MDL5052880.1 single-stranded DNA-binding protein [Oscillatoria laete-virens NRMC-F 0139]